MSLVLSDYDVNSNFGFKFTTCSLENEVFFLSFLFFNQLSSNLVQGLEIGCLFSKSGFMDDFGQFGAKAIILRSFSGFWAKSTQHKRSLPGDQKQFEKGVLYAKTKSQSPSFLDITVSELGGGGGEGCINRVNICFPSRNVSFISL